MKRVSNLFTVIVLGVFLSSCGSSAEKNPKSENTSENEPSKETQKAEVEPKKETAWQEMQVKDEFGDVIEGKSTIAADFKGTMTNSAVSGAELTVRMQIQDSTIYALFYEYSKEPQAQLPDSKVLPIKLKVSSGEVIEAEQFLYKDMMVDSEKELLNILLSQDKPVKVIVDLSRAGEYSSEIYNFEIDPNGLKEML